MAASTGDSGFAACTGRAVTVRRSDELTELREAFGEPGRDGATILIASAGCWTLPERAMAAITACGLQVIISPGFSHKAYNSLINAAILAVALPAKTIAKLQDTVESDPGVVLTVDVGRGELRSGGALLARFSSVLGSASLPSLRADGAFDAAIQTEPDSRVGGGEAMARRLLMAQRVLGSASLPGEVRMRLQRRLVAICDAMKAPGADAVRGARRLDRLLIEAARMGQPGPTQRGVGQAAAQARDPGGSDALRGGRRAP